MRASLYLLRAAVFLVAAFGFVEDSFGREWVLYNGTTNIVCMRCADDNGLLTVAAVGPMSSCVMSAYGDVSVLGCYGEVLGTFVNDGKRGALQSWLKREQPLGFFPDTVSWKSFDDSTYWLLYGIGFGAVVYGFQAARRIVTRVIGEDQGDLV